MALSTGLGEPKNAPPEAPEATATTTATASGECGDDFKRPHVDVEHRRDRFASQHAACHPAKAMVTCIQDDAELNATGTFKAPGSFEDVGYTHTPDANLGEPIEDGCDGW
ncbi:uncharacterized protein CcaverHIS019_0511470 [Cutaneotrichosporon cavernicola]|uniref:Uncharacterized protein n=1 Tax=Cutaneotrichosporon cavernicola TaxID=279322 RepID=A0AA48L7R1_9TREE|nr:uncharacterized protein CcaverHIS019_0511470 [Cutaneotrichosporon cavernicola]BEI93519.1 hypothetical protein CcaverHIS019_0511470 [Cutaneotrichosporon cavernicola]